MRFLRRVIRGFLPSPTRRFLDFAGLSLGEGSPPELVAVPAVSSVLVLAPHPDDEVVGCGGALAQHSRSGARITVVFMTDGRLGSLRLWEGRLAEGERLSFQAALVERRKAEARAAAGVLGISNLVFLDFLDGELCPSPSSIRRLRELLAACRPEIVYAPFPVDRQPDHVATARILSAAVDAAPEAYHVYAYEVWSPLYPNCMVDITGVAEVKREALRQFTSQVAENDLLHSIMGLNAYRAAFHLDSRGYAEAFYRCTPSVYRRLCRLLVGEVG